MIVSVDLGASLTKAAVWDGSAADVTPVAVLGELQWSSSLALQRDRSLATGRAAWLSRKSARDAPRYFAGLKQLVNLTTEVEPVHREICFPSGDTRPVVRGVLTVLDHVLSAVRAAHGEPEHVVLTHPVMWGDPEKVVLTEAATALGVRSAGLMSEAEAAGRHAAAQGGPDGTIAVFDLGASTFDFAVLRLGARGSPEVLAAAGRLCGGDDFTARLLWLVRREAGPDALAELDRKLADQPEVVADEANKAKVALSTGDRTIFTSGDHNVELYLEDFEEATDPLVGSCLAVAAEVVKSLGGVEIDRVVLTGGAARVPQFLRRVEGLAKDDWAAEFVDLSAQTSSSAAALGAPRRPLPWVPDTPRARRPFTKTTRAAVLSRPGGSVAGAPGGVVALSATSTLERHFRDAAATRGTAGGPRTPVVKIAADPSTGRVLLASPSPGFKLSEFTPGGDLRSALVFGRLDASPVRPDGEVTALACRGPMIAWTETSERGGALIDIRDWRWHPLHLREPVRELVFTDEPLLLVRTDDALVALETPSLRELASMPLPGEAQLAVDPAHGLVCVAGDGVVTTYAVHSTGFSPRWKRELPSVGAGVYPHGTTEPVLIVYDASAGAYRAFDERSGEQIALCDNGVAPPPDGFVPSPDAGVVYVRRGRMLDRLHLAEVRS
ncbi:Hsp70 family protein [Amycolatopsis sp. NPDC004772]